MLSSDEFDRRFDSGEDIEEFVDWSQKPVIIEPQPAYKLESLLSGVNKNNIHNEIIF